MSNIIGRWERTRIIGPNSISPSYYWDKKWNKLIPVEKDRFFQTPEGIWIPHVCGSSSNDGWNYQYGMRMGFEILTQTAGGSAYDTINLDSNYTYGSAGDAIGWRYTPAFDKTLNSWFYFVSFQNGSPGALTFEIREDDGSSDPGTTNPLSTTDTPSGLGWNELTGLSTSLTAGTTYWFIIGDAAGSASDYNRVAKNSTWANNTRQIPSQFLMNLATTAGWTSKFSSNAFKSPIIVLNFSDNTSFGFPFTESSNPTNNDSQKGLYIDGMNVDVDIFGVLFGDTALTTSQFSAVNIWENTDGPSGTPFATSSNPFVTSSGIYGAFFTKSYPRLTGSTPYRIVLEFSAASSATPESLGIGTVNGGGTTRLTAAFPGAGNWYWTEDNSGSWSDSTSAFPRIFIMIDDFQATSSGAGGSSNTNRSYPVFPTERSYPTL